MARYKVVVTDDRHGTYQVEEEILAGIGARVFVADCATAEEVVEACRDADGILVNLAPMPSEVIERLDKCKVIARYGVGVDNVDISACSLKGIGVTNVPDYSVEEVSDHALALIMACARKIAVRDGAIRRGGWGNREPLFRIAGKSISLLGFGKIARCLQRKIKGLNFGRLLVYDPYVEEEIIVSHGGEKVDLARSLRYGDIISVHLPLTDETRGLINREALALMKKSAIIINTSRGAVIDQEALIEALRNNRIGCAGLDVFEKEPLEKDSPLLTMHNTVLTDHIGWYSEESMVELKRKAAEDIAAVLTGNRPRYPVNKF